MSHIYCSDCGTKLEYSYSKPKFCSSCGNKFGSPGLIGKKNTKNKEIEAKLSEDETQIDELPYIESLEVDFESHGNNVFSFESLVGKPEPDTGKPRRSKTLEDFIDDRRG
jgi:ribosomal protein L37E